MARSTQEHAAGDGCSRRLAQTAKRLVSLAVACGALTLTGTAAAHEVPNEANWHIHDGQGPGPSHGDHHAGPAFFPALFAQEGLVYGVDTPYLRCPNATDKGLLPQGIQGQVSVAGVCLNDGFVVQLRAGTDAPAGWSTVAGTGFHYRLTPIG